MSTSKKSGDALDAVAILETVLVEQRGALEAVGDDDPRHVLDEETALNDEDFVGSVGETDAEDEILDPSANPVTVAARQRALAALGQRDGLLYEVRRRGAVVAILVEDAWSDAVVERWYAEVHDSLVPSRDRYRARGKSPVPELIVCKSTDTPTFVRDREERLAEALSGRRGAVVAVGDLEDLGTGIRLAVDVVVEVPPLDVDGLGAVAAAVGRGPVPAIDPGLPGRVEPRHLGLAVRPDDTAGDFMARLARIVAVDEAEKPISRPRWTLDTLPLPGAIEAWGRQTVADLASYRAGRLSWSDIDRGALVYGPPGTGKTTFARALAASAGVPLFAGGYSIWEGGRDGKGDYRELLRSMRKTFADAKKSAPAIIFIDEVDSFVARGAAGHNESWFAPIMNALLAELDGIEGREGVVVVAATNNPAAIDPALRRAGRLDRELELSLPDPGTLARILRGHLNGADLDYDQVVRRMPLASGADAERLARGARRRARAAGRAVEIGDLLEEIAPREELSPDQRRRVVVHEAGHALVAAVERPGSLGGVALCGPVPGALGIAWSEVPPEGCRTLGDLEHELRRRLAGRCAEVLLCGQPTVGAGGSAVSDLAEATATAASIEASYGLGGSLLYRGAVTGGNVDGFLALHRDLLESVHHRLESADRAVTDVLRRHRRALEAVADALLERDALTGAEVESLVAAHPAVERSVLAEVPRIPAVSRKGGVR